METIVSAEQLKLFERELESEIARRALKQSCHRQGGVLLIQGTTGVGKSSLLRTIRALALECGATVLHAQAGEFESDFPFAVTRQLFEPWFMNASDSERRNVFANAAKLAEPLFKYVTGEASSSAQQDLHSTLHGMYWMCVNLSARRPLVVSIDDAHWADPHSLRLASYLSSRLADKSLLVVMTKNLNIKGPADGILTTLSSLPVTRVIQLSPLSRGAAHSLAVAVWDRNLEPAVSDVCHEMTGGNPFLLSELLAEAKRGGVRPAECAIDRLRSLAPEKISQRVHSQLNQLPAPAVSLARAVAIFGAPTDWRQCARFADLDEVTAQLAAEALVGTGILKAGLLLDFVHPIIRTVIYEALTWQIRADAHARAARELADSNVSPRRVADQLIRIPFAARPWAVDVLREAARQALAESAATAAVTYLRRALEECPGGDQHTLVLAELGAAELRAHQREGLEHLTEALGRTPAPRDRGELGLELTAALIAAGRAQQGIDLADTLSTELELPESDLAVRLAAQSALARPRATARKRLARLASAAGGSEAGARAARTLTQLERLTDGDSATSLISLVNGEIADHGVLAEADAETHPGCQAGWILAACDEMQDARRLLVRTAHEASARGFVLARGTALATLALVLAESGLLAAAQAEAANLLGTVSPRRVWGSIESVAFGTLLHVLIECNETDAAACALEKASLDSDMPDSAAFNILLLARARVRIAERNFDDGLSDILEYRRQCLEAGLKLPAFPSLASDATSILARLGRMDEAASLAEEELCLARSSGAARPLAAALRATALVTGGRRGLEMLEEAVSVVEKSPSLLERVRTTIDYGAALRREGHRTHAREILRIGVELAVRCGAEALRRRGYSELAVAGIRMRRKERSGDVRSLTSAERRVADMAASGARNRDIAGELFVTVKTVEWHLNHVYAKLGVRNRMDLRDVLAQSLPVSILPIRAHRQRRRQRRPSRSTAVRIRRTSSSRTSEEVAKFRRANPLPSSPNSAPRNSSTLALSRKKADGSSPSRSARQSSHAR
jgi:DNA-binding CsgD family transcriptional regulator